MNLENYVCTLEQSKKLDKLLGRRGGIFVWIKMGDDFGVRGVHELNKWYPATWIEIEHYNAYTSQEMEEEIAGCVSKYWYKRFNKELSEFHFGHSPDFPVLLIESMPDAQACAEFLIYLLENKR